MEKKVQIGSYKIVTANVVNNIVKLHIVSVEYWKYQGEHLVKYMIA